MGEHKTSIYLPAETLASIRAEGERLDRPLSWIINQAWRTAEKSIQAMPAQTGPRCTGDSATWCPIHGDCKCPFLHGIPDNGRTLDDDGCPLHASTSEHGEQAS